MSSKNNNIETTRDWSHTLNKSDFRSALTLAFLGTFLAFLPLIGTLGPSGTRWPGFMMTFDQLSAAYPAYVEGFRRFWHGGIAGLDFFTDDGASIFQLRSNFSPYYPPILIAYLLPRSFLLISYITLYIAHEFLCIYFSFIFARKYVRMSTGTAVLFSVLYGLGWNSLSNIAQMTFYFQITLLPMVCCTLAYLTYRNRYYHIVLFSIVIVNFALTNYAPMMGVGLLVAIAAVIVGLYTCNVISRRTFRKHAIGPVLCLLLSALVCAPYYLEQLFFLRNATSVDNSLNDTAHALSYGLWDLVSGISQYIHFRRAHTEGMLVIGVVPTLILISGMFSVLRSKQVFSDLSYPWRSCVAAAALSMPFVLVCFGSSLPVFSDALYYLVPIVGKMHIYQRYMLLIQFLTSIVMASLGYFYCYGASAAQKQVVLASVCLILVAFCAISAVFDLNQSIDVSPFGVELILGAITFFIVSISQPENALIVLAASTAIFSATPIYLYQTDYGKLAKGEILLYPHSPAFQKITDFFAQHSGKKHLSKLFIASGKLDPYILRNAPWLISDQVKIMNFQGYPPHLSHLASYNPLKAAGGSVWDTYGQYDINWFREAGLDFVAWDERDPRLLNDLIADGIVLSDQIEFPNGEHLAAVNADHVLQVSQSSTRWPAPIGLRNWVVGNGVIERLGTGDAQLGFHVGAEPNHNYEVIIDFSPDTTGSLSVALANEVIGVVDAGKSHRSVLRSIVKGGGDLWINALPNFDGAITGIQVDEVRNYATAGKVYDDGIIKILGQSVNVHDFASNYTSKTSVEIDSKYNTKLLYLLWRNPYMRAYMDGIPQSWSSEVTSPAYIDIPPGKHVIDIKYQSTLSDIYKYVVALYAMSIVAITASVLVKWRHAKNIRVETGM